MDPKITKFFTWLLLVCLWNFGVPEATPIYDVIVAVILSFVTRIKILSK
jgi:F0F1-type ATP synthase membrane subunit c/vacuolar-type H+-ATPase subunit K